MNYQHKSWSELWFRTAIHFGRHFDNPLMILFSHDAATKMMSWITLRMLWITAEWMLLMIFKKWIMIQAVKTPLKIFWQFSAKIWCWIPTAQIDFLNCTQTNTSTLAACDCDKAKILTLHRLWLTDLAHVSCQIGGSQNSQNKLKIQ